MGHESERTTGRAEVIVGGEREKERKTDGDKRIITTRPCEARYHMNNATSP